MNVYWSGMLFLNNWQNPQRHNSTSHNIRTYCMYSGNTHLLAHPLICTLTTIQPVIFCCLNNLQSHHFSAIKPLTVMIKEKCLTQLISEDLLLFRLSDCSTMLTNTNFWLVFRSRFSCMNETLVRLGLLKRVWLISSRKHTVGTDMYRQIV